MPTSTNPVPDAGLPRIDETSKDARLARVGCLLCLGGATLGLVGLLGWITGVAALTTIVADQPPMMPNTAVGLLLVGIAGGLLHRKDVRGRWKTLSRVAALVVLAIGVGTLVEYGLALDLHIDSLLLHSPAGPYPGRPSPPTALALTLLGLAVLVFDSRPTAPVRPSEWLALAAGLVGFVSFTGFVFGAGRLYGWTSMPVIGVAVPTAVSVMLTSVGLLLERPAAGIMRVVTSPSSGGVMVRRLAPPTLLVPPFLGLAVMRLATLNPELVALPFAILAATTAVGGVALLTITAAPLNRTHEALEAARRRTQEFVEQAADGIFVADLDGRYTDVNDAGCRMLGCTREEIVGKSIFDLIPPADVERLWRSKARLDEGEVHIDEWSLLCKDGTYLPVEVSAKILADGRWQGLARDISERKRLEHALRLSEAKASGILSISADAIICIDDDQRITLFNDGAEEIFGWSRAEAIGAPLDMLIPERVRDLHQQHVAGFVTGPVGGRSMEGKPAEIVGLRKNGQEFPAEATISKLEVGGERVLTVALRDVTERQRAEERFELALRGANLAAWDWNIETGEVRFNARWAEMRGFHPTEIRPHVDSWTSGVHPDDWPRVRECLTDHLQGRCHEYSLEFRVRTKSGGWIWILDRGRVFERDQAGRPTRMVGTELDITERKRFEQALRASEHEERFLAELGAVVSSTLGYEETCNNIANMAVRELADVCIVKTVDETGGRRRLTVAHRDPSKATLATALEQLFIDPGSPHLGGTPVIESQRPHVMEEVTPEYLESIARSDEALRLWRRLDPKSLMELPLVVRGRPVGAMLLVSTESHRYFPGEHRLAEQVARRAASAVENALLHRTAQRAIQARDDVLGIVAHDLRNPLGIIQMHASLLQRQGARESAETLERAVARMNRLIQDLLDVTSIEAGHLAIERARVPTEQVISEAVESQRMLAASKSLELRLDVAPGLPALWADRDRILQVLENLLGNAIRITAPGGRITVGAAWKDGEVLQWVADTGVGIDVEDLPHLFDRFWQAPREKRRGAGLGLPIVKGIVEAHGGRVWVESTVGVGSTFSFVIPTVSDPPGSGRRGARAGTPPAGTCPGR